MAVRNKKLQKKQKSAHPPATNSNFGPTEINSKGRYDDDDDLAEASYTPLHAPRFPYCQVLAALLVVAVHVGVVVTRGSVLTDPSFALELNQQPTVLSSDMAGSMDIWSQSLTEGVPPELAIDVGQNSVRHLQGSLGYAGGLGAIFWMNNQINEDYPYSCKCNSAEIARFEAPTGTPPPPDSPSFFSFFTGGSGPGEGVRCQGAKQATLFSRGASYCDAFNAACPVAKNLAAVTIGVLAFHVLLPQLIFSD